MKLNVTLFSLVLMALLLGHGIEGKGHTKAPQECQCPRRKSSGCSDTAKYAATGAAAIGTIVAAPYALAAAGFGAAGVTAGTIGSYLMSLYGGSIPAAGLVAGLQSAGAAGFSATGMAGLGSTGAYIGNKFASFVCDEEEEECIC